MNLASKLDKVERFALRDALGDVEQHDVTELLEADEVSERAADLACADQRNLVTRHVGKILIGRSKSPGCRVISPFGRAVQVGTEADRGWIVGKWAER
jgi:hypothetical protein